MPEAGLSEVSRVIKSAMGETAGTFRKAANDNNAVIGRITRDLSKMFAQQRAQMGALNENMEEVVHHSQQTSIKVDRLANIMSESISIQTQMLSSLTKIADEVRILDNSVGQLQNSTAGGANSVTGWLGRLLDVTNLMQAGIQAAQAGIGVMAGAASVGFGAGMIKQQYETETAARAGAAGGTGGGAPVTPGKEFESTAPRIIQDLQRDFPGMTKEDAAAIVGNLGQESGGFTKMKEGGGGPGRGWAQWTSQDRKEKFLANVQKHGGDLSNYEANYETLKAELKGSYASSVKAVMEAKGLEAKTKAFRGTFERPKAGMEHDDVRIGFAQKALGSSTPSAPEPQSPATPGMVSHGEPGMPGSGSHGGAGGHGGHAGIISGATEGKGITTAGGSPLTIAEQFVGKSEGNAQEELQQFIGKNHHPIDIKKTPWCAAFVNGVLGGAGMQGTGSDAARSFLGYGGTVWDRASGQGDLKQAQPGDIAVFNRNGQGHVGFVKSISGDSITIIGGNQSDKNSGGQVSVATRSINSPGSELLSIRRPGGGNVPTAKQQPGQPPQGSPSSAISGVGPTAGGGTSSGGGETSGSPDTSAAIQAMTGMSTGSIISAATSLAGMNLGGGMGNMMGVGAGSGSMLSMLGSNLGGVIPEQTAGDAQMLQSLSQTSESAEKLNKTAMVNEAQQQLNAEKAAQSAVEKSQEDVNAYNANRKEGFPVAFDYNHPDDHRWPDWVFNTQYRGYRDIQDPIKTG